MLPLHVQDQDIKLLKALATANSVLLPPPPPPKKTMLKCDRIISDPDLNNTDQGGVRGGTIVVPNPQWVRKCNILNTFCPRLYTRLLTQGRVSGMHCAYGQLPTKAKVIHYLKGFRLAKSKPYQATHTYLAHIGQSIPPPLCLLLLLWGLLLHFVET